MKVVGGILSFFGSLVKNILRLPVANPRCANEVGCLKNVPSKRPMRTYVSMMKPRARNHATYIFQLVKNSNPPTGNSGLSACDNGLATTHVHANPIPLIHRELGAPRNRRLSVDNTSLVSVNHVKSSIVEYCAISAAPLLVLHPPRSQRGTLLGNVPLSVDLKLKKASESIT